MRGKEDEAIDAPALSGLGPAGGKRVRELLDWIDVPSISGTEHQSVDQVARALEMRGFDVARVAVGDGRETLFARAGEPRVVLCTHLDTVPPFIGGRADRTHVHGRGSCDAKGVALAMVDAAQRTVDAGLDGVGLLFTVGEEVDSDGARAAERALVDGALGLAGRPTHVVVGEPTSNRFVRGHKGMVRAKIQSHGVACHSSRPIGPSAIHGLVHCCAKLTAVEWGEHPIFGPGSLNVGRIEGGVADNVVAARAEAELLVRSVRSPEEDLAALEEALGVDQELEVHTAYGPVEFDVPEGEPAEVVAFGTDAPYLASWGRPMLIGPGDIRVAHTDHERIGIAELDEGVERYRRLLESLLVQEPRT